MSVDAELKRLFEQYVLTGESLFCATGMNDCGATIPLYKHFDYIQISWLLQKIPQ